MKTRWQQYLELKEASLEAIHKKPGGSDVGKDRKTSGAHEGPFVGPSGGAPAGSYPVTNKGQWRAALSYSHNAPNPSGIDAAADRIARKHGWLKEDADDMCGIYPPEYDGVGNYPPSYFGTNNPYIVASRNSSTDSDKKKKHKHKKKKAD